MAERWLVGMLFLRCRAPVSHSPHEFASAADRGFVIEVLAEVLTGLSPYPG
jgi:hypothetical protein